MGSFWSAKYKQKIPKERENQDEQANKLKYIKPYDQQQCDHLISSIHSMVTTHERTMDKQKNMIN